MYRTIIGGPNALWTPNQNFGGAMTPVGLAAAPPMTKVENQSQTSDSMTPCKN